MASPSTTLTDAQATAKLQAAGYTNVHGVEHEGEHYEADAMKRRRTAHVHLDPRSGAMTPADQESEAEENERHEHHPR